ncbi:uncharacterized protein HMPREF1541_02062 [Cyphellophora europaea CBS 101466]|uniref:Uncharacterized protein n=1 Tax=Cyphellophora europaea (strain CBS 101466) TaxID=1220924 RepID=W2S4N9_CYPE1|nr:uncharacterized protein HMPREF1541_02062 [Cyphellophora europaea CBS 101466]ETN42904.1 hypothetical protein HMPREF1541_02062 [Cyphellophora europaea CBS 101466]
MAGTPSSTTYQQPQRPHASLMRSWRERLDEKEGRNPRRARSTLSLHSRLPSLTEDEVVNERGVSSHGENVDPVNPRSTSPATPHGFTGVMPRFYPLAAGLATLPPTPSTLVVLFPGDEKEQLRARIVLASQELADKEEELAKEKKQAAEAKASAAKEMEKLRRKLKEAEENNRQLRERVATMTKDGEKEKWWS